MEYLLGTGEKMEDKRAYMSVGEGRAFNIAVILDDVEVYNGRADNAPEDIKRLKYSKIKADDIITY